MPVKPETAAGLRSIPAAAGFATSGSNATLATASLTARQLQELIEKASIDQHEVVLVAGVLTVRPRHRSS